MDASGDGDIACFSGAKFEKGREGDGLLQPMSIMFELGGVEEQSLPCHSEEMALEVKVGDATWHKLVMEANQKGDLPKNVAVIRLYESTKADQRIVNATQINRVDGTKAEDLTKAEFECREQAMVISEFIKTHAPGYKNAYISRMPAFIGVRETRRIAARQDLTTNVQKKNAIVKSANFVIDIHNPTCAGQAKGFAEKGQTYDIPYGCLVPEKVDGLIMAGPCTSGSHEAHASYRVQCICMATGAAAGTAAALSASDHVAPRKVDVKKSKNIFLLSTASMGGYSPLGDSVQFI